MKIHLKPNCRILRRSLLLFIASCTVYTNANAFSNFLNNWKTIYPSSTSGTQASCQLCHQSKDGGNGWNAYGWAIRQNQPNINIVNAIHSVANSDSDNDGTNNVTEIGNNQQPGWREGANNTVFCKSPPRANFCDGNTQLTNQLPPDFSLLIPTRIQKGERISLELISDGFASPNLAVPAPGETGFLYIVDQAGIVWRVSLASGEKTVFLDISSQLISLGISGPNSYDERGLLGLAFHPDYANNGLLYTYQSESINGNADYTTLTPEETANHQSIIAEWNASSLLAGQVNTATKRIILKIDQPQFNHNGGMIAFGPDNLLYISFGDGGSRDDQGPGHSGNGNGQDPGNPLGSMFRIEPLLSSDGELSNNGQYRIPTNNPFLDDDLTLPETYAYGLRNVFRFSFDRLFGDLYAADVGQGDIEEVSFIESGQNLGWPLKEGSFWFDQNGTADGFATATPPVPAPSGLSDPFLEYDHQEGISVIGGYVYRGNELSQFNGSYLFGDFTKRLFYREGFDTIRELDVVEGVDIFINGFGQDTRGEVYVMGNTTAFPFGTTGKLYKIIAPRTTPEIIDDDMCFPIKAMNQKMAVICL